MMSMKKGMICFLVLIVLFIAGCYAPQAGARRDGDLAPLRGGQLSPYSSGEPSPGIGGIGIIPGGN